MPTTVSAHHGDNHVPLVARDFRKDRAAMLAMVGALGLEATSADRSVLELVDYLREHAALTQDHIPSAAGISGSSTYGRCPSPLCRLVRPL
jgi:hypothetical protein